jgi:hypothetical protein
MRDHYRRTHARGRQRRPFPLQDRDSCFIGSFAERLCCRGQENGRRTGDSDNRAPAGQFRILNLILQVEGILYKRGVPAEPGDTTTFLLTRPEGLSLMFG